MFDENLPRHAGRGALLIDLAREDLDLYGAEELEERIARLEAEVQRAKQMLDRKRDRRSAAEALFSLRSS